MEIGGDRSRRERQDADKSEFTSKYKYIQPYEELNVPLRHTF